MIRPQDRDIDTSTRERQQVLVERARAGDRQALEALLGDVQPQLYRFAMRMCRNVEDAEDVVQDTMFAMARGIAEFRGASSFSTWMYAIVRSYCIRRRRRSVHAPADGEASLDHLEDETREAIAAADRTPEEQADNRQMWKRVDRALRRLAPENREIFLLRDVEGLRAREVAEVVGLSETAVKSRLHRARADVRETVAGDAPVFAPTCPNVRQLFSEFLEGDLSAPLCARMQDHVATCAVCARECEGLRVLLGACRMAPAPLPPEVRERLAAAVSQALATR